MGKIGDDVEIVPTASNWTNVDWGRCGNRPYLSDGDDVEIVPTGFLGEDVSLLLVFLLLFLML
jgi:hypothetical protein